MKLEQHVLGVLERLQSGVPHLTHQRVLLREIQNRLAQLIILPHSLHIPNLTLPLHAPLAAQPQRERHYKQRARRGDGRYDGVADAEDAAQEDGEECQDKFHVGAAKKRRYVVAPAALAGPMQGRHTTSF